MHDGRSYVTEDAPGSASVLDESNGQLDRSFLGGVIAFDPAGGYQLSQGTLSGRSPAGASTWAFTGDGGLGGWPVLANGLVFVASTSSQVYAVDEATGAVRWSATVAPGVQLQSAAHLAVAGNTLFTASYAYLSAWVN